MTRDELNLQIRELLEKIIGGCDLEVKKDHPFPNEPLIHNRPCHRCSEKDWCFVIEAIEALALLQEQPCKTCGGSRDEEIKTELRRRHAVGQKTGEDRLNLDALELIECLEKKLLQEQPCKTHRLPKECPEGGEHHWNSHCSKCDMRISYSPDCPEKKGGDDIA